MIDAKSLLDLSITGALDTRQIPVPVGEYLSIIEEVDSKAWQGKKDPSLSGVKLLCKLSIDDANVKAFLDRDKVTMMYEVMLDITAQGGLDIGKGKNTRLGQLREAVGLNSPTEPFSFRMLVGRPLRISVDHEIYEGNAQARIKAVTKA